MKEKDGLVENIFRGRKEGAVLLIVTRGRWES